MKIKGKLCLIYGGILTVIIVAISAYGIWKVNSISTAKNDEMLQIRANLKVKALDERLNTIFATLEMAAKNLNITENGKFKFKTLYKDLVDLQQQLDAIESYFSLENGVSYDSAVESGSVPNFNAKEIEREWFLNVFRDHKNRFMTEPYLSVTINNNAISIGVPVMRGGKIIGPLCVDITLDVITDYIASLSDNKNFFLTNENGTIFASKDPMEIGKNLFEIHPNFKTHINTKSAEFDYSWQGNKDNQYKVLMESVHVLDWKFWQYETYSKINQDAHDFLSNSIIFLIIFLILTLIVVYIVAGLIANPIIKNAKIITKFATTGDTNIKDDTKCTNRKDEIGIMSRAFNEMIEVLQQKAHTAREIANGNMCVKVNVLSEHDHLGLAFDRMVKDLNMILGQVKTAVNEVTGGALQINTSSNSLSDGATRQAAAIEEISASITELSNHTKTNADNATAANQLAADTSKAARQGQDRMNQLTAAMTQISTNAIETQKVIKTIDDIAFQTNLLALNAAVEAARAGTHGKGFAVVAEEVRNLAARSARAAAETANLIQNSNNQISEGVKISESTAEALSIIADNVMKTSATAQEIANASTEQAEGITQISLGLEQIDAVTQHNTANAEEVASTSDEMSLLAQQLQKLVHNFKLLQNMQVTNDKTRIEAETTEFKQADSVKTNSFLQKNGWSKVTELAAKTRIVNPQKQIILDNYDFGKY